MHTRARAKPVTHEEAANHYVQLPGPKEELLFIAHSIASTVFTYPMAQDTEPGGIEHLLRLYYITDDDEESELARLVVFEYPSHLVPNWEDALDSREGHDVFEGLVEHLREEDDLGGGTFFIFERLDVTPVARGQRLGLRLLAHAMWVLQRSLHDVFAFYAMPVLSRYEENHLSQHECDRRQQELQTQTAANALADYYAQLGLRRWDGWNGPGVVLWAHSEERLPFYPTE